MTPVAWFLAASVVSCVNLLSLMVDFETSLTKALILIGLGTLAILGINLQSIPKLIPVYGKELYVLTLILPLYFLFYSLSIIKGVRYAYTFVFCLSFTVFLDTLALVLMALTHDLLMTGSLCLTLLLGFDAVLALKYRSIYFEVQKNKNLDWALSLLIPMLGLVLMFILFEQPNNLSFPIKNLELKLIVLTILFLSHTLIFINFKRFFDMVNLEKHNKILEEMLVKMREELSSVIEKIRETQLHRHDLHHHLAVLSAGAHQHNLAEFDAYVQQLRMKLDEASIVLYCTHFSLNAVLSVYFKKAADHQIEILHSLSIPESLPLKDIDLALILANGLENAIHANTNVPLDQRFIDMDITHDDAALTLILTNPYAGEVDFLGELPQSTQDGHGFGSIGIFALAKRNGGYARFNAKKGRFTLIVQLPF